MHGFVFRCWTVATLIKLTVLIWQPRYDGSRRTGETGGERRAGPPHLAGGSGAAAGKICAECSGENHNCVLFFIVIF